MPVDSHRCLRDPGRNLASSLDSCVWTVQLKVML